MSGIYIPDMEIPSEQYGKMVITLYPNGHVAEYVGDMGRVWEAISVPNHGRLIDADALMKKGMPLSFSVQRWVQEVDIACAPAIIPADKEVEK